MLTNKEQRELVKAKDLWERDKVDDAWEIVRKILNGHPFNPIALQMGGHIYEKAGNMQVAYHLFRQATENDPREATAWLNFGRVAEELWRTSEAERAYEKALKYGRAGGDHPLHLRQPRTGRCSTFPSATASAPWKPY